MDQCYLMLASVDLGCGQRLWRCRDLEVAVTLVPIGGEQRPWCRPRVALHARLLPTCWPLNVESLTVVAGPGGRGRVRVRDGRCGGR